MKLKKTFVSAIAALGLAASVMAPVAMAQGLDADTTEGGSNTTNATVNVAEDGTFDVYFSNAAFSLDNVTIDALHPEGTASGTFRINYTDSNSERPEFTVSVLASDFKLDTNNGITIPATNFKITHTYNVVQFQWGGPASVDNNAYCFPDSPNFNEALCASTPPPTGLDVGDIGYLVNGAYISDQQGNETGEENGSDWSDTGANLSGGVGVHYGYAGVGTVWSYGDADVELEVPGGTTPGSYSSQLTLSVVAGIP